VGDERAYSRETITERERESWCKCVTAASSQGCWRRRRDGGMHGRRDERKNGETGERGTSSGTG